jgi:parallel beta-helix repeat protein
VTVNNTAQLLSAVQNANNGDTVQMSDGTYPIVDNGSGIGLNIQRSITLKSIDGAAHVTLTASTSYIAIQVNVPNVTIDGITIGGAQWGVQATAVSGVVLRNLNVSTVNNGGHSLGFQSTTNSVIELCTANNSFNHGISLSTGANYNLIINNTIQGTQTGDGIAVVTSDHNIISGNTINNTFFDGVTLNGSQYNYVALNKINSPHNGVTVTRDSPPAGRQSIGNYVGNNTMALNPSNAAGGSDGLWFNYDSNYNMAFGNDATASQENAMAIFNSVGNYIRANVFHQNPQGGIFVWNSGGSSGTTAPAYNSIQQNYLYKHAANGGVTLDGAANTDISFNYMAGDPALIGTPIAGLLVRTGVTNTTVTSNLIRDLLQGEQIDASASGISLFLNRHLNTPNHYTFAGASVQWDSGSTALGGNFFSDFLSSNGNPSNGSTPYTRILQDNQGDTGLYKDNYPYQSESLGRQYLVSAVLPSAGSSLAAGSLKTISWISQACVLVDLTLVGGTTSTIASNAADYGYFRWTVPNVAPGAYTVRIDCKDSSQTVRATTTTGQFNITPADLILLSPQSNQVLDSGNTMFISWSKSANVTLPVDVYINYSGGSRGTLLQSGVTSDFVTLPAPIMSSNQASITLVSGSYSDSTDGSFTIRSSSTGAFTSPASSSSSTLFEGTASPVAWVSPRTTAYVDIDLIAGATTKNIATQLADFSSYLMLVPALPGAGAFLRLTFHTASGTVLTTAQSAAFTIATSPAQPVAIATLAGTPQATGAGAAFPTRLQAVVRDVNSSPVPGVSVTFTGPSTGASGSFQGGTTVTTDASGIATAPSLIANTTLGAFTVTATSPSASGTANFNLTNTVPAGPTADSVSPSSGSGTFQTFTAVYSDGGGALLLNRRLFQIDPSVLSNAGACLVQVDQTGIFLWNDAGTGTTGPLIGSGTLTNSQCTLNGATTTVVNFGNSSTLTLSIAFKPAFTGTKNIYMFADDTNGNNSGYQLRGTFTVGGFTGTGAGLYFVPVAPCRVLDTRNAAGPFGGPSIAGQTTRSFVIPSGACGIPSNAQAYSMNVAVVPQAGLGFLTVWPTGESQPRVATLNSDGRVKSNAAIIPAGTGGAVSVFATNTTDVIFDINGYFLPIGGTGLQFYPVTPCRLVDTRHANAPLGGPFIPGLNTRTFPLTSGSCGIPSGVQAYSLNLAAVPRNGTLSFLTAWAAGQAQPLAATLNAPTGTVVSNAAIVPAGTGGSISVFATQDTDLVIDVNGYFAAPGSAGALSFYAATPCRVLDTRQLAGSQPFVGTIDVNVAASGCGAPVTAQAWVFNATVVPPSGLGFLTLWPQGTAQPVVATLNASDAAVTGNMAIVPDASGSISAFATNPTHLVLDLFGYFAP